MERNVPWDTNKNVGTYFNRMEQAVKQLDWVCIMMEKIELLQQVPFTFKESGELKQTVSNLIVLVEGDQTWDKRKEHYTKAFADRTMHVNLDEKQAGFSSTANIQ